MYNPEIHHRRSIRVSNYDYSKNCACFITINHDNNCCIFGGWKKGFSQIKWQRNFYERIIRNEDELYATRQYIKENPQRKHRNSKGNIYAY